MARPRLLNDINESMDDSVKNKENEVDYKVLIEQLKAENERLKKNIENQKSYDNIISSLQAQIAALSTKVELSEVEKFTSKVPYRPVKPEDWEEEAAIFTTNRFMFILGGYEKNGVMVYPPHKLIKFVYAASDVRKNGREDQILHYCQYVTNLKTEKEFLRNHPLYNVTFFENVNETMNQTDLMVSEYKSRAAQTVASMDDTMILAKATELRIPNMTKYTMNELRNLVIKNLAEQYQAQAHDIIKQKTQDMLISLFKKPELNDTSE